MPTISPSERIADVLIVELKPHADERGRFVEIFRKEWFPQRPWRAIQSNHSESAAGVLRGLHYHHRQVDYWYLFAGHIRVGLADLRRRSPTFGHTVVIDMRAEERQGLYIPVGVAHGFVALTRASLMYIVDAYYDGADEHGVAWNDPTLNIEWGIDGPVLSDRDRQNPFLADIPDAMLP
jgi:dTDP-4-dehydrorhamnose 3,5-epimerase